MAWHDDQNAKARAKERWSHKTRADRQRCLADPIAERALLAAILHDASTIDAASRHIDATDFYVPVHARAFEAMHVLRASGDTIDLVTLGASIGHDAAESLVASLPENVNVGAIASYAAIVADK